MDTDGSVYGNRHRVNGSAYCHAVLCFTNRSRPLLDSTERFLDNFGFRPRRREYQIYLNRQAEVQRYFEIIGTKNLKH